MSEDLQIIQKVAKYFRVPLKNLQLDESKVMVEAFISYFHSYLPEFALILAEAPIA